MGLTLRLLYLCLIIVFNVVLDDRTAFTFPFIILSLLFGCYLILLKNYPFHKYDFLLLVLFSLPFFWKWPVLSDDYFRFYWDGLLFSEGYNPYLLLPTEVNHLPRVIFSKLNSPNYYSVYPPLQQMVFYFSVKITQSNFYHTVTVFRVLILVSLLISAWLFRKIMAIGLIPEYFKNPSNSAQIALFFNPLLLIEGVGNVHFELLMMCLVLASLYFLINSKNHLISAILFGMAVSVKLFPLIILPLIWFHLKLKKGLVFVLLVFLVNLALALPFFDSSFIPHLLKSLNLYFQSFEFNASFYNILKHLGQFILGFNPIFFVGPVLSMLVLAVVLKWSFSSQNLFLTIYLIFCLYYLLTTTLHPWYLISPLIISFFLRSKVLVLWSFSVFLSYFFYKEAGVRESAVLLFLEYIPVIMLAFTELKTYKGLGKWFKN